MQSSSFVWICYRRCHHHFKNIQTGVTNNSLSPNLVAKISTDFHSDLGTTLMRVSFSPELRWWGQPPPSPPRWSSLSPPSSSSSSFSSSSLTSSKTSMKSPSSSRCWRAGSVLLSLCHFVFKLSLNCLLCLLFASAAKPVFVLEFLEIPVRAFFLDRSFVVPGLSSLLFLVSILLLSVESQ